MDKFEVRVICEKQSSNWSWGSVMHGMLIDHLTDEWKERMHDDTIRQLSQWVEPKNSTEFLWHIQVLDDELGKQIQNELILGKEWFCKHLQCSMKAEAVQFTQMKFYDYMSPFFEMESACDGVFIHFRTPTTHRSQGRYVVFPSVELIAQSVNRRICEIDPGFALEDEEALDQVIRYTRIGRYSLNSARYALEGAGLPGYIGNIELRFSGPDPLKRLAGVLFGFAPWSGIGVKTALGMGGCSANVIKRKEMP